MQYSFACLPFIPEIEGIKSYTGKRMHSLYHQNPSQYTDKTVCILGGAVCLVRISH